MSKSVCAGCNEIFGSVGSFDKHRVGSYGDPIYKNGKSRELTGYTKHSRRCLTPAEMEAKGMHKNDKGWWVGEEMPEGVWAKRKNALAELTHLAEDMGEYD